MTDNQTRPESDDPTADELAEEENIEVDALTGEVRTAVMDHPEGISPELLNDPYGEEPLSTSRAFKST